MFSTNYGFSGKDFRTNLYRQIDNKSNVINLVRKKTNWKKTTAKHVGTSTLSFKKSSQFITFFTSGSCLNQHRHNKLIYLHINLAITTRRRWPNYPEHFRSLASLSTEGGDLIVSVRSCPPSFTLTCVMCYGVRLLIFFMCSLILVLI